MRLYRRFKLWLIERRVHKKMYKYYSNLFDQYIDCLKPASQEKFKKLKTKLLEEYTKD